jgi:hypothetical protein
VAITETDTLVDVAVGVVVVMEGTSVMEMIVDTLTLTLDTVEAVMVVVGMARDRQPQAVEMREQSNATGAPKQLPVAEDVVDVVGDDRGCLGGGGRCGAGRAGRAGLKTNQRKQCRILWTGWRS